MAFRGGCYADFLPGWLDTSGPSGCTCVDFEQLVSDPGRHVAGALARVARSRPRSLPGRCAELGEPHHRVQEQGVPAASRSPATTGSSGVLRRHPAAKRKLRALLLPVERPRDRGVDPRRRCAPSSRRRYEEAERSGWPDSSTTPGSPSPVPGCGRRRRSDQLRFSGAGSVRAAGPDRVRPAAGSAGR